MWRCAAVESKDMHRAVDRGARRKKQVCDLQKAGMHPVASALQAASLLLPFIESKCLFFRLQLMSERRPRSAADDARDNWAGGFCALLLAASIGAALVPATAHAQQQGAGVDAGGAAARNGGWY